MNENNKEYMSHTTNIVKYKIYNLSAVPFILEHHAFVHLQRIEIAMYHLFGSGMELHAMELN